MQFEHLKGGFEIHDCKVIITQSGRKYVAWGNPINMVLIEQGSTKNEVEEVQLVEDKQIKCVVCDKNLTIKYLSNSCGCNFHLSCMREDCKNRKKFKCKCGDDFDESIKTKITKETEKKTEKKIKKEKKKNVVSSSENSSQKDSQDLSEEIESIIEDDIVEKVTPKKTKVGE